jgi:hypothetical protein
MTSAAFCYANPKPDASFRLLPCQSLMRDEHMGTGMGMMLGNPPRKAQAITTTTTTSVSIPVFLYQCFYTSVLVPRIFTSTAQHAPSSSRSLCTPCTAFTTEHKSPPGPRQLSHRCRHSVVTVQSPNRCPPYTHLLEATSAVCSGAKYRTQRELCEPPLRQSWGYSTLISLLTPRGQQSNNPLSHSTITTPPPQP